MLNSPPKWAQALATRGLIKKEANLQPKWSKKNREKLKKWQKRLNNELNQQKDKNVQVDLSILLRNIERTLKWQQMEEELGMIPFYEASHSVYSSLFQLINPQSPEQRKKDAVSRFKYYMSKKDKPTLIGAYLAEIKRHENKFKGQKKFYPFRGEIQKYLSDSPSYTEGVRKMLEKSGRDDWKKEFAQFKKEVSQYDEYVKSKLLPKSRKSPMYPIEVYQYVLKGVGVETPPQELIKIGQREYKKLYKRYTTLAQKIAKKNNLAKKDPLSVVKYLKKNIIADPEKVEALYNKTADRLERLIRENNIVTLPSKKLKIRFAGEAESKASPVPHLNPPPLLNNDGILPEFVVPTAKSGHLPFDDFSYKSAAAILTAHEGRPGHDLQFSRMIESPVSIIRARYAMNSVNVEGWAVYAEDLVYPYFTEEEKFVATQMRLWRIARYFLDPMVQTGKADKNKVIKTFNKELGVSKEMAVLEYNRYAFRSPGQATAYFEGLLNIREIKKDLEANYGSIDPKCFHDTLLSFGLLPHSKVRHFSGQFKKCQAKK